MEDLSADDDILSDVLVDNLEFEPAISTHKMNPNYRGHRFDRNAVSLIVRKRVVVEKDISAAIDDLSKLGIVQKYLTNKTQRQIASFQAHARRYLESYLPESGVEFALTTRYKRVMMQKAGKAHGADAVASTSAVKLEDGIPAPASKDPAADDRGKSRSKGRSSLDRAATSIGAAPAASEKADLSVLAMRTFKPGELINHCKGGLKDLTKSEDDALREEATASREIRKDSEYKGVLGPGRDFSVIRSARKGCSQLLLGPARFVNHDCNPNTEFYRMGSTMVFKVIRPIHRNEEITTFYGENYFEWANAECMCATCEARGTGAFSDPSAPAEDALTKGADGVEVKSEDGPSSNGTPNEANGRRQSRRSSRPTGTSSALPSPSPTPSLTPSLTTVLGDEVAKDKKSKRDYLADLKLAEHGPSDDRSDPWAEGAGPKCRCLTCGATFWAPEKWWTPDECPRCERHYKIFKADWPGRVPTEGALARKAGVKRKSSAEMISDHFAASSSPARNGKERSQTPTDLKANATPKSQKKQRAPKTVASSGAASTSSPATKPPSKTSNRPAKASANSSVVQERQDEASVARSLASPKPTVTKATSLPAGTAKVASKQEDLYGLDSDGSDLTPEPESDRGDAVKMEDVDVDDDEDTGPRPAGVAGRSQSGQIDRSSSSTSPGPPGPKMLGKNAKTDVLAQYWGAAEGDRRARRKAASKPGPTLLSARRASQDIQTKPSDRRSSFRETSTDEHGVPKPKRRLVAESASDAEDTGITPTPPRSVPPTASKHRKTSSMNDASLAQLRTRAEAQAAAPDQPVTTGVVAPAPSVQSAAIAANPSPALSQAPKSSAGNMPGLATSGVERTSESNLALFWSAGVGGTRNRRQAQREPQTVLIQTVPSKRPRHPSESSRSRTPEVKKSRASSRPDAVNGDDDGSGRERSRRSRSIAVSEDTEEGSKETSQDNSDADEDETDVPMRPYMFSAISKALQSNGGTDASHLVDTKGPLLPSAPLFRPPGLIRPDLATVAARSNSPLAGPPRGATGQPMRKNLRWGSGKTSMSRPLGPNGSPLGRPPTSLNGSPMATVAPRTEPAKDGASPLTAALAAVNKLQESAAAPGSLKPLPDRMDASPLEPSLHQPAMDQSQALRPESTSTERSPMVKAKLEAVSAGRPGDEGPATDVPNPLADGADAIGDAAESEQPKSEETPIAALTEQGSVQDAEMGVLPPEGKDVAAAAAEAADSQQRRTSGRARKAPEMAAGQIPYKGSLVKLAAQRAKEAKSGPNSPRSTGAHSPDARNQSPKSSRFMTPTAEVVGELAEITGKGEFEVAAAEEVAGRNEGDGGGLGAGMGAAAVASSHTSPMDLD